MGRERQARSVPHDCGPTTQTPPFHAARHWRDVHGGQGSDVQPRRSFVSFARVSKDFKEVWPFLRVPCFRRECHRSARLRLRGHHCGNRRKFSRLVSVILESLWIQRAAIIIHGIVWDLAPGEDSRAGTFRGPKDKVEQWKYPACRPELSPSLINYFWKMTIEALNCQINSPTEDN